ncbi:hypothetical protein N0Y54_33450 [Nostoc punctiforme UO1]
MPSLRASLPPKVSIKAGLDCGHPTRASRNAGAKLYDQFIYQFL